MTPRAVLASTCMLLLVGCGQKIELPTSEGIPIDSDYFDVTPVALADEFESVSDIEAFGGVFAVSDFAQGRVVVLYSDGRVNPSRAPLTGLDRPVAMELEIERNLLLIAQGEPGDYVIGAYTPTFEFELEASLGDAVQSISDIASDGEFLYVGDPEARTIHRFAMSPAPGFGPLVLQGTAVAPDPEQYSEVSPQFVSRPGQITIDESGLMVVCDADSTRNWVLRYDPWPAGTEPESAGSSVIFGPSREELSLGVGAFGGDVKCGDIFSLAASTLGLAPGCSGNQNFELRPSGDEGNFHTPTGVALDGSGNIYVADRYNSRIQRFSPEGDFEAAFGPGLATGDAALREPVRLATWDGRKNVSGERLLIEGARVLVVDAASGLLRIYEDSRWTNLQ